MFYLFQKLLPRLLSVIFILNIIVEGKAQTTQDSLHLKQLELNALQQQKFNPQGAIKQAEILIEESKKINNCSGMADIIHHPE